MEQGRFITFEGIEGAGKSTLVAAVADALRARGHRVRLTREPGGTPLAERLRNAVLERGAETIAPVTETLLMFAARGVHLDNLVRPALSSGEWVLCDRFTDATRAYQGGGRGVDRDLIERLALAVHGDLWPQLTLLLDLPVKVGLQRMAARGAADRIESEQIEFFERVRRRYLDIAANETARMRVLDADRPAAAVLAQAMQLLIEAGA